MCHNHYSLSKLSLSFSLLSPFCPSHESYNSLHSITCICISYMHIGDIHISSVYQIMQLLQCLVSLRAFAAHVSVCVLAAVLMQWTAEMGWTQKLEASLFSVTVESGNEKGQDGGEMNVSVALRINTVILAYVTKFLLHMPFIFTKNILEQKWYNHGLILPWEWQVFFYPPLM